MKKTNIILCDVDGVLTDFVPFLICKVGKILPHEIKNLPKASDIVDYNLFQYFKPGLVRNTVYSLMLTESFWYDMPLKKDSQEGIHKLRENNCEIFFITKPWKDCRGWVPVRMEYLDKHFQAKGNYVFTSKKEIIAGDKMIDDCPEYINNWSKVNPDKDVYVFDAPYNRILSTFHSRMFSWKKDVDKIIKNL